MSTSGGAEGVMSRPARSLESRRLVKPVSASLGSSVAIQGLNALTGVLLARLLGPEDRGVLAAIILWPTILAAVGSLGVADAATYLVAQGRSDVKKITGAALTLAALQSIALIGIGLVVIHVVLADLGTATVRYAQFFLAYIPLGLSTIYLMGVLNGMQRLMGYQVLRLLVVAFIATGLVTVALAGDLTVGSAVAVYLTSNAALVVICAILVRHEIGSFTFGIAEARRLISFGLRTHLTSASSLLNQRLDQLVISIFLAPAQLGLYVVAVTLSSFTTLIGLSTASVALPIAAKAGVYGARKAARRLIGFTLVASMVITLPLLLLTPFLIELLFGSAFLGVTDVARILLVAAVLLGLNRALEALLTGVGRPLDAGFAEVVALAATGCLLAALLPAFGLTGAAVASLVAYALGTAWMIGRCRRALGLSIRELLIPPSLGISTLTRGMRPEIARGER